MKRHILVVLFAVTLMLTGLQAAPSRADTDFDRGNAVPSEALPEELKALDVKDYYAASGDEPVGLIQTVTGHVVVLNGETGEAYFAAIDDAIFQQDALFTLEESRCRIKFSTEDVITMGEDTRIDIDELVDDRELQKKKSTISMLKGKAMFYVIPLFRYKDVSTTVKTPTAVCGVRGTKFGVEISFMDFARTDTGDTETLVYGFEGAVEVYSPVDGTSQMVTEGKLLQLSSVGANNVQSMDANIAEQFLSDTEAPAPEGVEVGGDDGGAGVQTEPSDEEGEAVEGEAAEEGSGEEADFAFDTELYGDATSPADTNYIDEINSQKFDEMDPTNTDYWPVTHFGYFTGMLTKGGGTKTFAHLYLSDSLQDMDSGTAEARDQLPDPDLIMQVDGSQDYDDPKITRLDLQTGAIVPGDFPFVIQGEIRGHNAYTEWGYWTQPVGMFDGTYNYYFDNPGYYIAGDYTTADQMSALAWNNVSGTYSGDAYGTYWTSTKGEKMSGDFSAHVDFGLLSISNFKVSVSGPIHSVLIDDASGGFSGSEFEILSGTGTWKIGVTGSENLAVTKEARGSVYGPNGEAIGGVWKLDDNTNSAHATGMFQGTK